jgi:AmmeMemoRadiSam system protein A
MPQRDEKTPDGQDAYAALARRAIVHWLTHEEIMKPPPDLPAEMLQKKAGVFVTLFEKKPRGGEEFRGCLGSIWPKRENLATEIISIAIASSQEDPRCVPVRLDEMERVEISVSVLEEPVPVESRDELDPRVFGVVVRAGHSQGVLLPDLPGVDTVDQQLEIAARKAGLRVSEIEQILRFRVEKHVG